MPHEMITTVQRHRARDLRRTMNRPETLLWRFLKAGHLDGRSFRRQAPLGRYIVDFVCHEAKLIVEVDGESHDFEARVRQDGARDAWLASRGFRVLRFTNDDVMGRLEGVLSAIRDAANSRLTPLPSPPPQGGREPVLPDGAEPQ